MKRLVLLLALLSLSTLSVAPAGAAVGAAADFAADCNAGGVVTIAGVQKYVGGSAVLSGDCVVALRPGARLVFRNVELSGAGNLVAISSPDHTTIKVIDSTIKVNGFLELTAGCCAGDGDVPENDGTVIVKNSTLVGQSVLLIASFDWPNGTVIVRNSILDGSGSGGVQIRASDLGGSDGLARVVDSEIASGGDLEIRTGSTGLTVARRNQFTAAGAITISTASSGICRSSANVPTVRCT